MLEILIFLNMFGFFLSSLRRDEAGNPFQIYFCVWSLLFLGFKFTESSWIPVSSEFLGFFVLNTIFWLIAVLLFEMFRNRFKRLEGKGWSLQ